MKKCWVLVVGDAVSARSGDLHQKQDMYGHNHAVYEDRSSLAEIV